MNSTWRPDGARSDTGFRRPPTTHEAVLAELRQMLVSGRLRPGDQIRQEALATELDVSRVPIREALKTLESEGQITYRPRRGYFVTELSLDDVRELHRLRELLEEEALRVSLPRLTPADRERLAQAQHDLESSLAAGDVAGSAAASRRFHFALFEPCGMVRLMRLIRVLWDATEPYRSTYFSLVDAEEVLERNREIIAAIARGDTTAVMQRLAKHRQDSIEALKAVLEPTRGSDVAPAG